MRRNESNYPADVLDALMLNFKESAVTCNLDCFLNVCYSLSLVFKTGAVLEMRVGRFSTLLMISMGIRTGLLALSFAYVTSVLFESISEISYSVKELLKIAPKFGQNVTSKDPHGADIQNLGVKRSTKLKLK